MAAKPTNTSETSTHDLSDIVHHGLPPSYGALYCDDGEIAESPPSYNEVCNANDRDPPPSYRDTFPYHSASSDDWELSDGIYSSSEELEHSSSESFESKEERIQLDRLFIAGSKCDLDYIHVLHNNIDSLMQHSDTSRTKIFSVKELRMLMEGDEYILLLFMDALYDPDIHFLVFPLIVDNDKSSVFMYEKVRSGEFPTGNFYYFGWEESLVAEYLKNLIEKNNFEISYIPFYIVRISKYLKADMILNLTEELFEYAEKEHQIPRNFGNIFKAIENKISNPLNRQFRKWNAEKETIPEDFHGRSEKFLFCLVLVVLNAVLSTLLYFQSSTLFSWIFFIYVLISLAPKIYGSVRYIRYEKKREKEGFYKDDYMGGFPDRNSDPATSGWDDIEVEAFRDPDWILRDHESTVLVAANTPMYDENLASLAKTIESYINLVREYPYIEPTFLIDRETETYANVMKLLFDEDTLVERMGVYYVHDSVTRMKRLKNNQILYQGYFRGTNRKSFNVVWKPNGGGKRDSQLLFIRLIHLGVISKPQQGLLYCDADTCFTPADFGRLHNGLIRDPRVGAVCGEIVVRNLSYTNRHILAQAYEYQVNHMLSKAAESYYGIVLCCPGAWCMYRIEAVEAIASNYSATPTSIREFHRLEQGEDRYQNTLCLVTGWKAKMIKSSRATTQVPDSLKKLIEQRRRWNNSTLENTFNVLKSGKLWLRATLYMVALLLDTLGFYVSPSIFLTLFGRALSAYINLPTLSVVLYAIIFLWILIQLLAGLSLYPKEALPMIEICCNFSTMLMGLVGLIAILQIFTSYQEQGPLIAGIAVYAISMIGTSFRYGGVSSVILTICGGIWYIFLLPTFYITFLLYSVARYDTTSWR
eukprot:TRINITY_DN8451_c0_g1_i1.p1 TRINITY_DN8451_c0_g1~~TRINITY_DN8451_c0_g1_i1.p1  ORF type:complete len:871 (+),score=146.17 TRINITY_DN8451_c0_g1_i1:193-2805(+)